MNYPSVAQIKLRRACALQQMELMRSVPDIVKDQQEIVGICDLALMGFTARIDGYTSGVEWCNEQVQRMISSNSEKLKK